MFRLKNVLIDEVLWLPFSLKMGHDKRWGMTAYLAKFDKILATYRTGKAGSYILWGQNKTGLSAVASSTRETASTG